MSICSELLETVETFFDELKDFLEDSGLFDDQDDDREGTSRQAPVPGDIIGVDRGIYQHYGVYVGEDKVIHYTADTSDLDPENAVIQETSLERFLRDESEYFILDAFKPFAAAPDADEDAEDEGASEGRRGKRKKRPSHNRDGCPMALTPEDVVARAQSRIGEKQYNLLTNNCEHFAVWCKTGISGSTQVRKWVDLCRRIFVDT